MGGIETVNAQVQIGDRTVGVVKGSELGLVRGCFPTEEQHTAVRCNRRGMGVNADQQT